MSFRKLSAACLVLAVVPSLVAAAEWGTLKGRFVFDGKAPAAQKLAITDQQCKNHAEKDPLFEESLLVGADGGVANVVIYIRSEKPAVHPDYEKTANDEVTLDNTKCRFLPHVLLLRTTQTLVIKNSDTFSHNTNIALVKNEPSNNLIPARGNIKVKLPQEEALLGNVSCNIHPHMRARAIVRSNPYMAASDEKGNFEIKNVPAGTELEFQLIHENPGFLKNVVIKGVSANKSDAKGRFKLKVATAGTDLGDIKLSPTLMQKK